MAVKIYTEGGSIILEGYSANLQIINPAKFDWKISNVNYILRDGIQNQTYDIGAITNIQDKNGVTYTDAAVLQRVLNSFINFSNIETGLSISKGDMPGTTYVHKFGKAPDYDIADGFVSIWDGANDSGTDQMQYIYSSTAAIDSISSSNGSDTEDIEIQGLDSSYNLVIQTITLTGQTRAALTTNLIRVFRLKNVGSSNLLGNVYVYENTALSSGVPIDTTKIRAIIGIGNNQTLMAIYTVPAGKTAYMRNWYAATAGALVNSVHEIRLFARPFGQVFQLKHDSSLITTGSSHIQHLYFDPEKFEEKTDIEMKANTDTNIAIVSAGFDLVLIDN
jgi:hypothetical protein